VTPQLIAPKDLSRLLAAEPDAVLIDVRPGHVAARILLQHGFRNVRNLKGGYTSAKG
jgi:rhodanese-related sulfurtransferase